MSTGFNPLRGYMRFFACTTALLLLISSFSLQTFGQRNNLTFSCDFEGSTLLSVWPTVVGRTTQSSDYSREGSYSARVEVVKGDPMIADGARSEMNLNPITTVPAEQWFGMSYYIPASWTADADGLTDILAQWHSESGTPPVAFGINVNSWYVQFQSSGIVSLGTVNKGTWTDVVFHMKWSTGSDGLTEIWINGTKVGTYTGSNFPDTSPGPFFKCGDYKWPWNTGSGEMDGVGSLTSDRLLYVDAVRVGNANATYADVAPGTSTTTSTPVISLNATQSITLPTNIVSLTGTVTDLLSVISTTTWSEVSGPNTATINSPTALTTSVSGLIAGTYVFKLTALDILASVASASVTVIVNPAAGNTPPVANAGPNQAISLPVNTVTLNGSASNDPDGTISSYAWSKLSGPAYGNIMNADSATTLVTNLAQGDYTYQLTITDNSGATNTDTVHISVNTTGGNQLPVANAGAPKTIILPTDSITLDGTNSYDPDGIIAGYNWNLLSGPATAIFSNADTASPLVSGMVTGKYIFQLTVTDNNGATASSEVKIIVANTTDSANQSPIANAGGNQTITLPVDSLTINGTGSIDPDGAITAYKWIKISGPTRHTIVNSTSVSTVIDNLAQGSYVYELVVTDNNGASNTDTVTVVVNPAYTGDSTTANAIIITGSITRQSSDTADINASGKILQPAVTAESVLLYPNPAQDIINLRLHNGNTGTMKLGIYDMTGKLVLQWEMDKTDSDFEKSFNIQQLAHGTYAFQVLIGKNKKIVSLFLKQ